MRQRRAAVPAKRSREALCRRQIEARCELFASYPFEIRTIDVQVRRVTGARGLAAALAVAMRKLLERRPHSVRNGATETASR